MMASGARALGLPVIPGGTGPAELQLQVIDRLRRPPMPARPASCSRCSRGVARGGRGRLPWSRPWSRARLSCAPCPRGWRRSTASRADPCYATADLGLVAYETAPRDGMMVDEGVLLEMIRPGTGQPVPDGEVGEVLVTAFSPDYPLIRFATGDLSAVMPGRARAAGPTGDAGWLGRADRRPGSAACSSIRGRSARCGAARSCRARPAGGRCGRAWGDQMSLYCEVAERAPGLEARLDRGHASELTGCAAAVELVAAGSLPNDGQVIDDRRSSRLFTAIELACIRGGRLVFAGLSFELAAGDALVLRGPNGSGKSRLLRLLAGFLRPGCRRARLGGQHRRGGVRAARPACIRRPRRSDEAAAHVRENLAFAAGLAEDAPSVVGALARFDLAGWPRRRLAICPPASGGAASSPACWRGRARSGCSTSRASGSMPPAAPGSSRRWAQHRGDGGLGVLATHGDVTVRDAYVLEFPAGPCGRSRALLRRTSPSPAAGSPTPGWAWSSSSLALSLFPFGVGASPDILARVGDGVVWVVALLAVLLTLDRLWLADPEDGSLGSCAGAVPLELLVRGQVPGALADQRLDPSRRLAADGAADEPAGRRAVGGAAGAACSARRRSP